MIYDLLIHHFTSPFFFSFLFFLLLLRRIIMMIIFFFQISFTFRLFIMVLMRVMYLSAHFYSYCFVCCCLHYPLFMWENKKYCFIFILLDDSGGCVCVCVVHSCFCRLKFVAAIYYFDI